MARQITFLSFNQLVGEVTRLIAEGRRAGDRFAMESHNPGKGRPEIFYKRSTGCHLRNLTRPIHGKGMGIFSAKKKQRWSCYYVIDTNDSCVYVCFIHVDNSGK